MQWVEKGTKPLIKGIRKLSNKKVMCLVFWDNIGVLLVKFFRKGATLTGAGYAIILEQLKKAIQKKRDEKWDDGVFLLHDNTPCHTSRVANSALNDLGFIQLSHPPYSPDLAPSDYFLFSRIKNFLRKRRFNRDEDLEKSAKAWFKRQPPSFYNQGISALPKRWE
jgi:[histone H3]-lysine36 N-dimethyltransferase SETMAR